MPDDVTKSDPAATGWAIDDPVLRLRVRGTERAYDLRGAERWLVGAASDCSLPLDDPSGRLSRRHAALERERATWTVRDLDSTNGIRQDGEARRAFQLAPGDELELGGLTLIAESARSIELHQLLRRCLGWSARALADADRALRAVRDMATLRAALILRGDGSLVGIARRLARLALGAARPFVVVEPGQSGMAGFLRASDGVLCLAGRPPPRDIHHVVVGLCLPDARVRLVACARSADAAAEIATLVPRLATLQVPALAARGDELDRVLEAFGRDAMAALGARELGFRPHDLRWLRDSGVHTLDEAEDVTHRLVALRNWGVSAGAARLGVTHGALSRWARRRRIPT